MSYNVSYSHTAKLYSMSWTASHSNYKKLSDSKLSKILSRLDSLANTVYLEKNHFTLLRSHMN